MGEKTVMAFADQTVLVTGSAGFIGFHLSRKLLEMGYGVVGIDNLNPYYDVGLKKARLEVLKPHDKFRFIEGDIQDLPTLQQLFKEHNISRICNLAAQAGVRHSLKDPFSYQKSNIEGFLNLLEMARAFRVENFVYASSSSVYGKNKNNPYKVEDRVDNPISLYAATKKANELMAHAYSHLYDIPCTGLRFFTVYGPWGRPDMALFLFTDAILHNRPINIFNYGDMRRDFTYIDDIVAGTVSAIQRPAPYEIYNLGNSDSTTLMDFIEAIELELGQKAEKNMLPMQPGDVAETSADITKSREKLGFTPQTPLKEGIRAFIAWYREYYGV
jgi:UDP-glucuronate 4-epimerase